jgi:predicted acylesterase/phospholipase RssA
VSESDLEPGWPTPEPVHQQPPDDRFCDLVLTGGVASGVVYPWAVVELARHFRFRNLGGNSVGAMAAALAAAAEYGRCCGYAESFEVLRQSPRDLAQEDEKSGHTRMLRLFQPQAGVRRLFECLLIGIRHFNAKDLGTAPADLESEQGPALLPLLLTVRDVLAQYRLFSFWLAGVLVLLLPALALTDHPLAWGGLLAVAVGALLAAEHAAGPELRARRARLLVALLAVLALAHGAATLFLMWALGRHTGWTGWSAAGLLPLLGVVSWTLLVLFFGWLLLRPELRALKKNGYGLCPGRAQPEGPGEEPGQKALVEWLHEGIQRSAGRERGDPPLTFADLWAAPRAAPLAPGEESISLQVFSTNVTLGRPVVWPLRDGNLRLFFRHEEWAPIFSPSLLEAVWKAARPYRQQSAGDPEESAATEMFRELPAGGMPIAIAARLSLSFPLLFSCVPVHAIDYEMKYGARVLRRCLLTDGGVCTNFPIHLFDQAHPKWPTFGLLLSRRIARYKEHAVWLPDRHGEGRADNWSRAVPGAELGRPPSPLRGLGGLLSGMLGTALRWNDNLLTRLPHVRNRVLRMALRAGEGQLHITMPRETILQMAHEYGTKGGLKLVERFVSDTDVPTTAWQEHLYLRAVNELRALTQQLRGYGKAVSAAGFNTPLARVLADAAQDRPLRGKQDQPPDKLGDELSPQQQAALQQAVQAVAALARVLEDNEPDFGPYQPVPQTHMHVRSQI